MKFYLDRKVDQRVLEKFPISGIISGEALDISTISTYILDTASNKILRGGDIVGKRIVIDTPDAMKESLLEEIDEDFEILLIETGDWHIIPLENLIAKFSTSSVELIASASTPEEIRLLQNVLELGVQGCLLKESENYSIEELFLSLRDQDSNLNLHELEVSSIQRIGNGDRVCVDTVSLLKEGEGMLVGSTAAVQALVQAEVEESGFVAARPFRINAGVVASYTLNFSKTNYLSEIKTGSGVMIVDRKGHARKEFVARVKIERRPLVVINLMHNAKEFAIVLQDAETIRLVTVNGSVRVDEIQPGNKILAHISDKARHFGMEIEEFLEER